MVAVVKRTKKNTFSRGGCCEPLGKKFRNETEDLLPSPPSKTIIKKDKKEKL